MLPCSQAIATCVVGTHHLPKDVTFFGHLDSSIVRKILLILRPPGLVDLPASVRDTLEAKCTGYQTARVTPAYLHDCITAHEGRFLAAYISGCISVKDINALVRVFPRVSTTEAGVTDTLAGLPILPTLDGGLEYLHVDPPISHTPLFYGIPPALAALTSPRPRRCLHPGLLLDAFSSRNAFCKSWRPLRTLMDEVLGAVLPTCNQCLLSQAQQSLVSLFWAHHETLSASMDIFAEYPLIPITSPNFPGRYISLKVLQGPTIFPQSTSSEVGDLAFSALQKLGAICIPNASELSITYRGSSDLLNSCLQRCVVDIQYIFRFLQHLDLLSPIYTYFDDALAEPERDALRNYVLTAVKNRISGDRDKRLEKSRSQIHTSKRRHIKGNKVLSKSPDATTGDRAHDPLETLAEYNNIIRKLPIWRVVVSSGIDDRPEQQQSIWLSADNVKLRMLPVNVQGSCIGAFLRRGNDRPTKNRHFVQWHDILSALGCVRKTTMLALLEEYLKFPDRLTAEREFTAFLHILPKILECRPLPATLRIPNAIGMLLPPRSLYSRKHALFEAVLTDEHFLHPSLQRFESELKSCYEFHSDVGTESFLFCAQVLHERQISQDTNLTTAVFEWYNRWAELMPTINAAAGDTVWKGLDGIRFIPRHASRRRILDPGFPSSSHAVALPSMVSCQEIVRAAEYEAIAWTQRGLFAEEPTSSLLALQPMLGMPSAREVVEHLRALVLISTDHGPNVNLLSDLTETYSWISDNAETCQLFLVDCQAENLFLNVDDPSSAPTWAFSSAEQLVLGARLDDGYEDVAEFLLPFRPLLRSVGVREIIRRPYERRIHEANGEGGQFRQMLNEQRLNGVHTDCILKSTDGVSFNAHRSVLATTEHFASHYRNNWSEREDAGIDMHVTSAILQYTLSYIYLTTFGDITSFDRDDLCELLQFAHYLHLPQLFIWVEDYIIPTITVESCDQLLSTAELLDAEVLAQACGDFKEDNQDFFVEA
ncbi:hypothetical protein K474DRAFT_1670641 [Panus rudis PR-1116 ss-1]|nr:hypothetical protein K474DRAFT_1670641 [Panus rudis PR-1116 ss-1]